MTEEEYFELTGEHSVDSGMQDYIENFEDQAELFDMDLDWESLELVPKRVIAKKWQFEEQDNWAGDPEQAWA